MPLPPRARPDGLVEVADRVWGVRAESAGRNAALVAGSGGVAVVDDLGCADPDDNADTADPADPVRTAVRRLGRGDVLAVVLSHGHPASWAGAAGRPRAGDVPLVVHEAAAASLGAGTHRLVRTVSSVTAIDLGDRVLEVVHPGRSHTGGDLVVRVPDVEVVVVGDLLTGDGPPSYGPECWPLEWPASLDLVLQLMGGSGSALAVPGRGPLLERSAVEEQRDGIATVAETIRELAGRGVPEDRALAQGLADGSWPWPGEQLSEAVRRGYAQLPRGAVRLPLA